MRFVARRKFYPIAADACVNYTAVERTRTVKNRKRNYRKKNALGGIRSVFFDRYTYLPLVRRLLMAISARLNRYQTRIATVFYAQVSKEFNF